jgi:hypothetical protein
VLGKVSSQVLDAVYARLSAANGYNSGIATQAPLYNLTAAAMQLDFSSSSQNFYFDQIDSEDLEKSGTIKYPFACLYILDSAQTGEQKFSQFSGIIRCVFEVNLSWVPIRGTQSREVYSSCVEDVVIDVFNRVENQNWGKPLVYNGQIQCRRGPTMFGAQNFKKKLWFSAVFGLHQ